MELISVNYAFLFSFTFYDPSCPLKRSSLHFSRILQEHTIMAYIADESYVQPRKGCLRKGPRSPEKRQRTKKQYLVRFLEVLVEERTLLREHTEKIRKRTHRMQCDRLKEQQVALEDRLEEIQAQHEAELASIQSQRDSLHQQQVELEVNSTQHATKKKKKKHHDARHEISALRRENELLKQQQEKLERNSRNLRCNNIRLEKALERKKEQMTKLQQQHERIEHKHERLVKQEQSLKQQVEELEQDFKLMERHFAFDVHMHTFYQTMANQIMDRIQATQKDPSLTLKVLEYVEATNSKHHQHADEDKGLSSGDATKSSRIHANKTAASHSKRSLKNKNHHSSHRSHTK